MNRKISVLLIISIILSGLGSVSYAGSIEYEGYKKAYYDKLIDFRKSNELLDGASPVGRDAALVSHFNGEIPALMTISYFKSDSGSGVLNYKYRVYIYEDGELNPVRLSQNIIDNDADYNFYSVNVGGNNTDMFRNDYYIARNKESDTKYLLSHMENYQDGMFDMDDEYYDSWAEGGYREDSFRLEGFLEDIDKNILPNYKELVRQTNNKKEVRYYYQDTSLAKDNHIVSKTKYNSIYDDFKKDYRTRLLKPTDLDEAHIKKILTEDRDIKIIIDNKLVNLNAPAIIVNARTLVPVRSIFEALDMDVKWDEKNQLVSGEKDGRTIKMYINSDLGYVDNKKIKLDSPAIIKNSRTLVPLRFLAEAIDGDVKWDGKNRTINIRLK